MKKIFIQEEAGIQELRKEIKAIKKDLATAIHPGSIKAIKELLDWKIELLDSYLEPPYAYAL